MSERKSEVYARALAAEEEGHFMEAAKLFERADAMDEDPVNDQRQVSVASGDLALVLRVIDESVDLDDATESDAVARLRAAVMP